MVAVTAPVAADPFLDGGELDCLIEPRNVIKLGAPVDGIVAAIEADRGDAVTKGQVVARLESGVEEAVVALAEARAQDAFDIQSSRARFEFLQRKQDRATRLKSTNVVSASALDEAEMEARVAQLAVREAEFKQHLAKLELKRAQEILNQRVVRSPVDGVVVERLMSPGEYRHEQAPILAVAEIDPLNVEVFVPLTLFGQVKLGGGAVVVPEQPVGGSYAARVTVVDQVLDAASGTFGVRLELPNPGHRLPAGIRCRIRFKK
ncbi:MAG: efflux RND transporter periplasmic adaptor subunit [Hyphomicrobiales bacterium]|nr:efflux RND transporter periplasmic adaptor subunit [Hyphomicrobiales bacterium]MCP5373339.1 efflux RND transporter periplasmic adaptor subunit [Hyphomicrobiales bacterium]